MTAEGETLVRFRAVDGQASPRRRCRTTSVQLDRTAPSLPTVSGAAAGWQNVASVNGHGFRVDRPLSGLAGYQYADPDDGSTWCAPIAGAL